MGKPSAGAFFDSDFSTIDDVLATALLFGLQGKNECRVAVVSMSRSNLEVAGFLDAVQRFYRGPAATFAQVPPIGMPTEGSPGVTSPAFTEPFQKLKPDGTPVYRNEVKRILETGDPNTLFRNYLQAQYDHNAFFVLAGPATNLAAALDFPGMKDLIAAKVNYLVVAGGAYPFGAVEGHIQADIPGARKVFAEWPTPIVASGYEMGELTFPGASIDKEFAEAIPDNPVADAYRAYQQMPYNTPSWALAAALYAGRPNQGYFQLSSPGKIEVEPDGRTRFTASDQGNHRYLIADPMQTAKIVEAYIQLTSAKPVPPRRFRPPVADKPPDRVGEKAVDPPKKEP
jgi:inosine-uridine nucleoside N-ribohydrolase